MILIKIGGGKTINWDFIAQDLSNIGKKFIIIHGANAWMKDITRKFGLKEKIITSPSGQTSRYTDSQTLDLLTMVYSGLINKKIVAIFQKNNLNAIGLSGADGKIWLGKQKDAIYAKLGNKTKIIRDSLTGNVISVNKTLINLLLKTGFIPVITIPAITADGLLINVDNDRAAAVMVRDLNIKKMIILFEAPGLLEDKDDETSLIKFIQFDQLDQYITKTDSRMKKKLLGVKEAIHFGAKKIYFGDGRIPHPIKNALKGGGTTIC